MSLAVNVTINAAPELINAINLLASSLGGIKVNGSAPMAPAMPMAPVTGNVVAAVPAPIAPGTPVAPMPLAPAPAAPAPVNPAPAVPTTTQAYTMDQLAVAATQLVDSGRREELVALLTAFGVQALTQLPKEQYGNFATYLRSLGVRI